MNPEKITEKIKNVIIAGMLILIAAQITMFNVFNISSKPEPLVNYVITFIILIMVFIVTKNYLSTLTRESEFNKYYIDVLIILDIYAFTITVNYTVPLEPQYIALKMATMMLFCLIGTYFVVIYSLFYLQFYKMSKKQLKLIRTVLWVSYAVVAAVIFSNPFTHILFYITEDAQVIYPGTYNIINIFALLWTVFHTYHILRSEHSRSTKIALLSYGFFLIISLLVDLFTWKENEVSVDSQIALCIFISVYVVFTKIYFQNKIELEKKNSELQKKQTQIMVSQIQPHFLYNTLSAIYVLCDEDLELAKETIMDFSKYLRHNMNSLNSSECVPFEQELKHTETYLEIEKLRFGPKLTVEYDIGFTDFRLPSLSLQPITENAVKYGVRSRKNGGTVKIKTYKKDGKIYVSVYDTGVGFDPQKISDDGKTHIGIENTRNRIKNMCGGELNVESSEENGTTVTIVLEDKR